MSQTWLQEGINEIRKELNEWPEWKRTTAAQQGTKGTGNTGSSQNVSGVKKKENESICGIEVNVLFASIPQFSSLTPLTFLIK
jgi:hypothetical protein